jgi:hypothetical protein
MDVVVDAVQLPDDVDSVSLESPHNDYEYDGGDSSEDGSIMEGNGELIFARALVDQDLQCSAHRHTWWMTKMIWMIKMPLIHNWSYPCCFLHMQHICLHPCGVQRCIYLAILC